ncbi:hypothetical protein [Caballeronia sp. GAWG1-5s-s]|jgi:hypothetical protein|uniref:hypothetical protein n=1 Tax=Caballeronia sp. GAWG1-5s-s TaxID=2921743 RepID=UPI00202902B3|nr:hypothetical protein [Caballeronia sp. GAWG1-5s-s]
MKTASLLLKLSSCAAAALLVSGCMMDPPGPSPIYSRLPSTPTTAQQTLTPEEHMQRYNEIDRQALSESQQAATAGNNAKMMSGYYTPPISVYGGYSSGGWGGPYWGTGVGIGTWW